MKSSKDAVVISYNFIYLFSLFVRDSAGQHSTTSACYIQVGTTNVPHTSEGSYKALYIHNAFIRLHKRAYGAL